MPRQTVRLRLTLLYSGLFFVTGAVLLVVTYIMVRRSTGPDLVVAGGNPAGPAGPPALRAALANPHVARYVHHVAEVQYSRAVSLHANDLHQLLVRSGIALAIVTLASIALGWLVAGRVLRPLRAMTATTRRISQHNLHERLALAGPRDELKDLADTIDGLLARLQAHVAEQQRFAANASHELRTPLALTQTLLDVARKDPDRDSDELVERLHAVNTRAIDLTEALLLLSQADRRSFDRGDIDLSLVVDEAAETLLPFAEQRGIALQVGGDSALTLGSQALLQQLVTNLIHNAIVHNLSEHGTVWVTTRAEEENVVLTVENTGARLLAPLVPTLVEPFQRGAGRIRTDHAGLGLGLAIVKSIAEAHAGTLALSPRAAGGLSVVVQLPRGIDASRVSGAVSK